MKLTKCSKDIKRIIKKHHELKNHKYSKVQRIYEKSMRKVKIIKEEVANVLKKYTTCITIKKSKRIKEKNSIAIEKSRKF